MAKRIKSTNPTQAESPGYLTYPELVVHFGLSKKTIILHIRRAQITPHKMRHARWGSPIYGYRLEDLDPVLGPVSERVRESQVRELRAASMKGAVKTHRREPSKETLDRLDQVLKDLSPTAEAQLRWG